MGNICTGNKPELKKPSAFQDTTNDDSVPIFSHGTGDDGPLSAGAGGGLHASLTANNSATTTTTTTTSHPSEDVATGERLKALREEQARLDMIVSAAGRGMVSVRSTRGSTGYYDQGFAAALAQHLEQTTQFPNELEVRLPPPSSEGVYVRLSQPQWQDIKLGNKDGLAGCAGENPNTYMDHIAESLLDTIVPAKQQLFAGVAPMIENLL